MKKFSLDCHNALTNGILIIEIFVNVINDFSFTIILSSFYFIVFYKANIKFFSFEIFWV